MTAKHRLASTTPAESSRKPPSFARLKKDYDDQCETNNNMKYENDSEQQHSIFLDSSTDGRGSAAVTFVKMAAP